MACCHRPLKSGCGCQNCSCANKITKIEHPLCENGAVIRFREYLRIQTSHPHPNYGRCVEFLKRQANDLQMDMTIIEPCGKPIIILTMCGMFAYLPSLLLMSHMDVVPAVANNWTHDPFEAVMDEDGMIYGRGAQGMKLHGIQYLEAIRRYRCEGKRLKRSVHVLFLPDSEIGGEDGMKTFVNTQHFKELNVGFAFDKGVPSCTDQYLFGYNERALWQILIRCSGVSGDAGFIPNDTATVKMLYILHKLTQYRENSQIQIRNDNLDNGNVTSINLTRIQGGVLSNVIASDIRMIIDLRISPTCNSAVDLENSINTWCCEAGKNVEYEFIRKDCIEKIEPLNEHDPWWNTIRCVFERMNSCVRLIISPLDSDARFLREKCIPVLGFTPLINSPNSFHSDDECIHAKDFLCGIDIYQKLMIAIANTDF